MHSKTCLLIPCASISSSHVATIVGSSIFSCHFGFARTIFSSSVIIVRKGKSINNVGNKSDVRRTQKAESDDVMILSLFSQHEESQTQLDCNLSTLNPHTAQPTARTKFWKTKTGNQILRSDRSNRSDTKIRNLRFLFLIGSWILLLNWWSLLTSTTNQWFVPSFPLLLASKHSSSYYTNCSGRIFSSLLIFW
jgi:hypothetical protein